MKLKIFYVILFSLSLFSSRIECCSCGKRCEFFNSPKYLSEDGFNPSRYDFKRALTFYFPAASLSENEMTYEDYIYHLKLLLRSKDIDETITDSLKNVYYTGTVSNSYSTALAFLTEAFGDPQVTGGWQELIEIRHDIFERCSTRTILERIQRLKPDQVAGYGEYLEAAYYFYEGEYERALPIFQKLKKQPKTGSLFSKVMDVFKPSAPPTWLEETAAYMEARTLLVMSQDKFNGYEWDTDNLRASLDDSLLERSIKLFDEYLKEYPRGRYAESAKNLNRRFYFLLGQQEKLDQSLREALNDELRGSRDPHDVHRLFTEFMHYFKGDIQFDTDHPLLLACYIQTTALDKDNVAKVCSQLEQQKSRFAGYPGLFHYLKALLLYRGEDYQAVVDTTPQIDTLDPNNIITSTTEVLRAESLCKLGRLQEALVSLRKLKATEDDQIDLLILRIHMASRSPKEEILKDLAPGLVFESFVKCGLTESELDSLLNNTDFSEETQTLLQSQLLNLYLSTGQLKQALQVDSSKNEEFVKVRPYVQTLVDHPSDNRSLLEIGKWLMEGPAGPSLAAEELSYECPECAVEVSYEPPLNYFMKIVENHDSLRERSMVEAEALHVLIDTCFRGYAPARSCQWSNDLGKMGDEETTNQRDLIHKNKVPRWFLKLHTVYKGSEWAKKTRYYY